MKKFFYKDEDGKIRKYVYCTKCDKGPFTEDQLNRSFFRMGDKLQLNYCIECAKELGISIKKSDSELIVDNNITRKVEDISFHSDKFVYLIVVQFYDGSMSSFICENINDRLNEIYNGILRSKLPVELIYYESFNNKKAIEMKNMLDSMNRFQKNEYIAKFYSKFL